MAIAAQSKAGTAGERGDPTIMAVRSLHRVMAGSPNPLHDEPKTGNTVLSVTRHQAARPSDAIKPRLLETNFCTLELLC